MVRLPELLMGGAGRESDAPDLEDQARVTARRIFVLLGLGLKVGWGRG